MSALRTPAAARASRRFSVPFAAAVFVGLLLLPAVPAGAAVSCTRSGTTLNVTMGPGDIVTINRQLGGALLVNGKQCGGSRVDNIDLVRVRANEGAQKVTISMNNGPLGPGATPESSGISEIEFDVELGASLEDTIQIIGSQGPDFIGLGTNGVALNTDNDTDIVHFGTDLVIANGNAGADLVSGMDGGGTGVPISVPLKVNGGPDDDLVYGGYGNDIVNGNDGDDLVWGGPGDDKMVGGLGIDTADYSLATNAIQASLLIGTAAGDGADTFLYLENLFGGSNSDTLQGDAGDNVIDGNAGFDTCDGAGGADTIVDCEA